MSGIHSKPTHFLKSSLPPVAASHTDRLRQQGNKDHAGQSTSAFKRVVRSISQQWKLAKNALSTSSPASAAKAVARGPSPTPAPSSRTVRFPSTVTNPLREAFPYQVSHTFSAGALSCPTAPSLMSLMPQLAGALRNKQGFVYILDNSGRSPVREFVERFRAGGTVNLGHGCRLVGAHMPPPEKQSAFSPLWTFQVYDANLQTTFDVPVTEVPFTNLADPDNRTEQLIYLNHCMDTHLRALPEAFKDSPASPHILCPEFPRLAQLLTAQEECLGRQYRGDLNCRESIDWIVAAEELLKTISPESPRFRGEESCDFESFFRRLGIYDLGLDPMPFSIGHPDTNLQEPGVIRGFKRHLPNTSSQTTAVQAKPRHQPLNNPHEAGPSRPDWLLARDRGHAYKEPTRQMQCAAQAINCVLQRPAVSPEIFAQHVAAARINTLDQLGLALSEQSGLTHPNVMAAMINGQSVRISKQEFMGLDPLQLDIATEQTPAAAWQALVNMSPLGQGKNWVQHREELNAIAHLTITPDMWLSAQRGAETTELLSLLNNQLQHSTQAHQPRQMTHWSMREHHQEIAQLERHAQRAIAHQVDFPIVVRTGGESGHFQTIVPDSQGNWLTLNSDATTREGIQPCNRWCHAGELALSFQRAGVSDILIPNFFNT